MDKAGVVGGGVRMKERGKGKERKGYYGEGRKNERDTRRKEGEENKDQGDHEEGGKRIQGERMGEEDQGGGFGIIMFVSWMTKCLQL